MSSASHHTFLAPFQVRSFRFLWPAELASAWALEMETLILGWYVMVETGSVQLLSIFSALMFFGALISPLFGWLGDRLGHREVLRVSRTLSVLLAGIVLALVLTRSLTPMLALGIAALLSTLRMADLVTRFALYGQIMPPGSLMGALGLSRATVDSARVAGALAGAGLIAAFGMGPAYGVIVVFYLLCLILTLVGIHGESARSRTTSAPRLAVPAMSLGTLLRELRDALTDIWHRPPLLASAVFAFLLNLAAFPVFLGLLPYVAKVVYGSGQIALGYMAAAFAFGSLAGSLLLSATRIAARTEAAMIIAGVVWFALLAGFAFVGNLAGGLILLVLCGVVQSLSVTPIAVVMLRHAEEKFRGRVMGIRMLAIYGLPIGLVIAGPIIEHFGFTAMALGYPLVGISLTLWLAWHWRAVIWRSTASPHKN